MSDPAPTSAPTLRPAPRGRAVVIAPASAGGLGDQAMIDVAARELTDRGFAVAIIPSPTAVRVPITQHQNTTVAAKLRILWEVMRARVIIVIGADILDGSYDTNAILKRLRFNKIAHRFGAKVRVIGSSFSPNPHAEVVAFLKSAPWMEILARERVSQERMQTHLGRPVPLVADSAFLLRPEITSPEAETSIAFAQDQKAQGRRVLALNVSGLIFNRAVPGTLEEFATTVANWVADHPDIAPLIVAHDRRGGDIGDVKNCDMLAATITAAAPDRTHYVRDGIAAWDVKAIAAHLDMAFVCRMHFAIACLGNGVPPLSLVSMGKFEGLMEHFGLDGLTLDPVTAAADAGALHSALDDLEARAPALRAQIEAALPEVRKLSAMNYEGL